MNSHRFRLTGACILSLRLLSREAIAQGTVIAEHLGPIDPATEGFDALRSPGASLFPAAGGPNGGAWSMNLPTLSDGALYTRDLSSQERTEMLTMDWTLSITVQITPPYTSSPYGMGAGILFGTRSIQLGIGATAAGDPLIEFGQPLGANLELSGAGSGYHNYQIRYEAATQDASLWLDGAEYAAVPIDSTAGVSRLVWGGGQRGSPTINANWSEVTLTIVPEPTWLGLFCFGGLALVWRRRSALNSRWA